MNIKGIKQRAMQLLVNCQPQFIRILTIIFIIMLGGMLGSLSYYAGAEDILISMVRYAPMALFLLMIFVLLIIVVIYIISQFLFAVPYLLEQYHMKNGRAISESVKFMRGHMVDLFKLDISFLGWILLEVFISGLVMALLGDSIFVTLLASAASGLFSIYTYYPKYQLSRTIFFEEIAYRRYGMESVQSTIVDQDELVGE